MSYTHKRVFYFIQRKILRLTGSQAGWIDCILVVIPAVIPLF